MAMYLDTAAAAEYLSVSPGHLANLRCRGVGPKFHRAGRKILYTRRALDAFAGGELGATRAAVPQKRSMCGF